MLDLLVRDTPLAHAIGRQGAAWVRGRVLAGTACGRSGSTPWPPPPRGEPR